MRIHRLHKNNGNGKPLCNVKKWKCLTPSDNTEDECVECKYCLKIMKEKNSGAGE